MVEFGESVVATKSKISKAAAYLHKLMQEGNSRLVMLDLFKLGTMGQAVALELYKRLSTEQQTILEEKLSTTLATDAPRVQQRRALDELVKMHDIRASIDVDSTVRINQTP